MTELFLDNIALERAERRIVAGVSARIRDGGALVLHGPNGSGKSTMLRVLAGLLPAAEGAIRWNGADVTEDRDAHRARLIYIGHQDALKPGLSVLENLDFWARYGRGGDVGAALRAFDLTALADRPVRLLSAGQKRRLALSRLALRPMPLWLLDEPMTALDGDAREAFIVLLERHLAIDGLAVIATHHELPVTSTIVSFGQTQRI